MRFTGARWSYLNAAAPRQDAPETGVLGDGRARRLNALDLIQRSGELVGLGAGRLAPGLGAVAEEPREERVLGRCSTPLELGDRRPAREVHVAPHEHVLLLGVDAFIFLLSNL